MANVAGAYCGVEDMRTGDIAMPSNTSREQYVSAAAEEIDAALGHIYETPFVIEETPVNRPTILFLKKLNWLLASGRFVLDVAAAGEHDQSARPWKAVPRRGAWHAQGSNIWGP